MKEILLKIKELKPVQLIFPVVLFVLFLGTLVGVIRYQQNNKLQKTPKLEIIGPADGAEVNDAQIVVQGKTTAKNKIFINQKETKVNSKGDFYAEVSLLEGQNKLQIIAENKAGVKNEITRTVTRRDLSSVATSPPAQENQPSGSLATTVASQPIGDGKGNLSSSGPENFWIPEALGVSGSLAAWVMSRKRFKKAKQSHK